jgi:phage shock protein A
MGIFTRVRDIISSNINAMLDKAEDPEKLVKLMIQEMEDTLVEIKASCAGAMAAKKRVQRALDEARTRSRSWGDKAELAVNKGREDLAREALLEKRRYVERTDSLDEEAMHTQAIIEQYQEEIGLIEEKLATAREKQRILVQRHIHAKNRKRAQEDIRKFETSDVLVRFEQFENRIERMEAEADLVNFGRRPALDDEFASLERDEDIERELEALKVRATQKAEEDRPV